MEHRKRHLMQHKMETSILLRLATATRKSKRLQSDKDSKNLLKALAAEAIKSASINDRAKLPQQLIA